MRVVPSSLWALIMVLLLLLTMVPCVQALQQQQEKIIKKAFHDSSRTPLTNTILMGIPLEHSSPQLAFVQRSTKTRLEGLEKIQAACRTSEDFFQSDQGVTANLERIATTTASTTNNRQTLRVYWNVTWVPPTALWLEGLANIWPGVDPIYTTYNHISSQVSTFSWKAVFFIFRDAMKQQQLRIPLACIQGFSDLEFSSNDKSLVLESVQEDLVYALDLERGVLLNRKCANDLRLFLETARCSFYDDNNNDSWDEHVALSLPWSTVPGSNPLDIDPLEETNAPAIFLSIVAISLFFSATILAPELIGQNLLWEVSPNYIVPPEELNSFI